MSDENPKWPYRIPETEQEIKAAIGWLKETGQIPVNGRIKNGPRPMPLDRLGLPMEEVKDLMALHGAGSFGRQVGVQVRKEAAGCVTGLINLKLVGVGIVLFILFIAAMVGLSHSGNSAYYQTSVAATPTAEVKATPAPDYAPRAELVHLPRNQGE
jgi:Na+-transporting methylmalonyl-CoA/oxaloacetate decarboxylase gamma subunit